jgi:hypothetical protein
MILRFVLKDINYLTIFLIILRFRLFVWLFVPGERHILFATLPSPSVASVAADFGPFAVLLKVQNTPLRERPVPPFYQTRTVFGQT